MKCPKIGEFHFRFFFYFKIDHVLIFWNARIFLFSKILKCPSFPFSESNRNSNFKIEKEPKMNFSDFGAFQEIMHMLSHDTIIFQMFFGHFTLPPVLCQNNFSFWISTSQNELEITVRKNIVYILDLYGSGWYEYGLVKLRSMLAAVGRFRLIFTQVIASSTKAIKMRQIQDHNW